MTEGFYRTALANEIQHDRVVIYEKTRLSDYSAGREIHIPTMDMRERAQLIRVLSTFTFVTFKTSKPDKQRARLWVDQTCLVIKHLRMNDMVRDLSQASRRLVHRELLHEAWLNPHLNTYDILIDYANQIAPLLDHRPDYAFVRNTSTPLFSRRHIFMDNTFRFSIVFHESEGYASVCDSNGVIVARPKCADYSAWNAYLERINARLVQLGYTLIQ